MSEAEPPFKKTKTTDGDAAALNLQSLKYSNDDGDGVANPQLEVLDQLLVPHEKVYIPVPDVETAYTVIKTMQIRGACEDSKKIDVADFRMSLHGVVHGEHKFHHNAAVSLTTFSRFSILTTQEPHSLPLLPSWAFRWTCTPMLKPSRNSTIYPTMTTQHFWRGSEPKWST